MAVTLPFLVLIFEALYSPPATLRFRCLGRWLFQEGRAFWPAVLITLVFARGKLSEPSVFAQHSAYTPLVSWKRYFETSSHYLDQLFYRIEWFDATKTVLFWLVLFTIAWVTRNVHLKFSALFLFVSILPVSFIPPRAGFVLYIPMVGWALYGAAVLATTRNYVFERLRRRLKAGWRSYGRFVGSGKLPVGPSQVALFLGVALILAPAHAFRTSYAVESITKTQKTIRRLVEQLRELHPRVATRFEGLVSSGSFRTRPVWNGLDPALCDEPAVWGSDDHGRPDLADGNTARSGHLVELWPSFQLSRWEAHRSDGFFGSRLVEVGCALVASYRSSCAICAGVRDSHQFRLTG